MAHLSHVYCYGMLAPSTLHLLETAYPKPNSYSEIKQSLENLAGEAIAGAWVLQRLGIQTKLDGRWLSDSAQSQNLLKRLKEANIDVSRLRLQPNYHPIEEIIISDGNTRTIFGGYHKILFTDRQWNLPSEEDIEASNMVLLDPFLGEESIICAKYCVKHNVPYITCDIEPTSFIAQNAFSNIISYEFLLRESYRILQKEKIPNQSSNWDTSDNMDSQDLIRVFQLYLEHCSGWVVFTFGEKPLWYSTPFNDSGSNDKSRRKRHIFKPCKINVKDTTGAGDSFRSGFAYACLTGKTGEDIIKTASAVAGIVCERAPGVLTSPNKSEVEERLNSI